METVAVFRLPASPGIVRAGCREPQIPLLFPDYKLLPKQYPPIDMSPFLMPRAWPPLTWYNFFSNYLWHFSISLFNFFPYMFFDIRYGYALFPDKTLDYNELTYDADELKINIAGTTYAKTPWDSDVVTYTFTREDIDCWLVRSGEAVPPVFGGQGNEAPDTYAEAITAYADSPNYYIDDGTPYLYTYFNASAAVIDEVVQNYKIEAGQVLVSFDTSSLSGKTVTSATLRLYVPGVGVTTTYGTNQVNLYNHSFGTVGSADWTGGTLISTTTLTDSDEGAYTEFALATTDVNTTGNSQFRLGNKVEIDGGYPTEPTSASHERQQVRFYYQVTGDYQVELVVEAIG